MDKGRRARVYPGTLLYTYGKAQGVYRYTAPCVLPLSGCHVREVNTRRTRGCRAS